MVIKKFTGKTEAEATEAARNELGDGIVIMNVRPAKRSGFFSFLFSPKIEVTVALEDEQPKSVTAARQQARPANGGKVYQQAPEKAQGEQVTGEARELIRKLDEARAERGREPGVNDNIREAVSEVSRIIEKELNEDQYPASGRQAKAQTNSPERAAAPQVKKDQIQTVPQNTKKGTGAAKTENSVLSEDQLSFIKILYTTLLDNEVDEIYANQLTDEVEKYSRPGIPLEQQLANVYQKMVLKFGPTQEIKEPSGAPLGLIFLGPTGVGKTTTIAKLASELYVGRKAKVALITIDTFRIAAAEQLRTYAAILEIPFRVIYTVDEMKQACSDFGDYDYIMVDTAGHNLHNEEQKKTTISFLETLKKCLDTEQYLVLSATTKYRDLLEIADGYSEFTDYKLIFTKMDETGAAGNLYNLHMHTGAPISYITNGQNVPDDISAFNAQKTVKGLLSETNR